MTDTQRVWLITGASRGIGLEIVRQLSASPNNTIIATCRSPPSTNALKALGTSTKGAMHIVALDTDDRQSVQASAVEVATILGNRGVDYLINNAGFNPGGYDRAFTMELDNMVRVFKTNVVGSAHVAQAYLPLVEKSTAKTIVNVSSTLGSMGSELGELYASYSISKAALNMLTYKQCRDRPDLTVISMCPGHLKTDGGGENAKLEVSVGVAGVLKVIKSLTLGDSGKFFRHSGEEVPW
ncbi:NAD-P-binding protein [Trametes versicolor FP-101664 SS1]|uniref:NAD-P-binding protein n=1 Tax=Trametes versicolor (strain FP-101664) TaxID=717944 RepID=UPI000462400E|nr:NAD-P-binding protein [Trametes versicolor FP-101664 SS1]EIW54680.1 NAD-P-binding protein [Trametes versicolor FP-101664 SS1]